MLTLITAHPIDGSETDRTRDWTIHAQKLERGPRPDGFDLEPAMTTAAALMAALNVTAVFVADHDTHITRPIQEPA